MIKETMEKKLNENRGNLKDSDLKKLILSGKIVKYVMFL